MTLGTESWGRWPPLLAVVAAGCGGLTGERESKEVVLVTHDSFAIPKEVKAAFEQESGLKLTILQGGDAGEMLNRALLTKGKPQGDALFGIDNNLLSRARRRRACSSRTSAEDSTRVDGQYRLDPTERLTPIDHGDVCLNVDKGWFASHGVAPRRASTTSPSPPTGSCSSSRTLPPRRRGSHSCSPPWPSFGEPGWRDYWRRAPRERRARRRRLGGGVHGAVLGCRRQQGQAADRGLVRDEPAGRGDVRDEAHRRRHRPPP